MKNSTFALLFTFFTATLSAQNPAILLSESFEGAFPLPGWKITDVGAYGNKWSQGIYEGIASHAMVVRGYEVNTVATTPPVSLNYNKCYISFYIKKGYSTNPTIRITTWNFTTQRNDVLVSTNTLSNNYEKKTYEFLPQNSGSHYFNFEYASNSGGELYIDSVVISQVQPSCTNLVGGSVVIEGGQMPCQFAPFTLGVVNSTAGVQGLGSTWQLSTDGVTWGTLLGETGQTLNRPNGVGSDFYYRRKFFCNNQIVYSTAFKLSLTVPPVVYTPLPYSENFETTWMDFCNSKKAIPSNYWRNQPLSGNYSWRRDNEGTSADWDYANNHNSIGANNTTHSASFNSSSKVAAGSGSLLLHLDCSTGSNYKELKFYYYNPDGDDSLFVDIATNGVQFNLTKSYGIEGSYNNGNRFGIKHISFISSSPTTIIRFRSKSQKYVDRDHGDMYIDEVSVASVKCFTPSDIVANGLLNTGDISWKAPSAANPSGYEYAITTSSTPPATGTFITTTSVSTTALAASTKYYAHVRSVCNGSGNSEWITAPFTTATANCIPQTSSICTAGGIYHHVIRLLHLKGENNTAIKQQNNTCAQGYRDYSQTTNVSMSKGKSYSCIIRTDTMYNRITIWIDFNDDGAFTYNEKLLSNFATDFAPLSNLVNLYIPTYAATGSHKMRVRMNSDDPCETIYFGEAHDYTVTITGANTGSTYTVSPGTPNTCVSGGGIMINASSNNNNAWVPLTDSSNNIIASINANGNNLGRVNVFEYINSGTIRSDNSIPYLDRNNQISVETQPQTNVSVRFYFTQAELNALMAADPSIKGIGDLAMTKTPQPCGSLIGQGLPLMQTNNGVLGNAYFVEFSIPSFSSFYLHKMSTVLPIVLNNFNVEKHYSFNKLTWKTSTEADNVGFEVQRSENGIAFNKIGFIGTKANTGNSTSELAYSFEDAKAFSSIVYYRLQQVDKNNKATFSKVVSVQKNGIAKLQLNTLYPNPVRNALNISISSSITDKVSIIVSNSLGEILVNQLTTIGTQANSKQIDVSNLTPGIYFTKMVSVTTGEIIRFKFVKL